VKEKEEKGAMMDSSTLEGWKPIKINEMKDGNCQVKDGCPMDDAAGNKKPGMISRFSKGIKKIIAKITPTKLRKRWKLDEEEPNNGEVDTKH
jgi:hypothetical protein